MGQKIDKTKNTIETVVKVAGTVATVGGAVVTILGQAFGNKK